MQVLGEVQISVACSQDLLLAPRQSYDFNEYIWRHPREASPGKTARANLLHGCRPTAALEGIEADRLAASAQGDDACPTFSVAAFSDARVLRQTWLLRNGGGELGTRRRQCVCRGYDGTPLESVDRRGARGGGGGSRVTSLLLAHAQTGEARAAAAASPARQLWAV
ncbi:hypothetical protein HPB47_006906 [Ixodes persulcatus]|uniref:Uncharacterized protein n=1 Tax=Ixodes persulcatus TaxID=34615 RepID=A0AC60P8V9_IXOPE|nr:hypothetical protein HPB47_006906 [Ixodes persulcatus]